MALLHAACFCKDQQMMLTKASMDQLPEKCKHSNNGAAQDASWVLSSWDLMPICSSAVHERRGGVATLPGSGELTGVHICRNWAGNAKWMRNRLVSGCRRCGQTPRASAAQVLEACIKDACILSNKISQYAGGQDLVSLPSIAALLSRAICLALASV